MPFRPTFRPSLRADGAQVTPTGIASAEAFGSHAVAIGPPTQILSPIGIASAEAFGLPSTTAGPASVAPSGIASAEAFGAPAATAIARLGPPGIPTAEAFGAPAAQPGPVTVGPAGGIASTEIFGPVIISRGYAGTGLFHDFTGPGGARYDPLVANFEDTVEAPGGFAACSGSVSAEEYNANKAAYAAGTTWRVWDRDTDKCVFAGELRDPEVSGGTAVLAADGWGKRADREYDNLLWQTRDLEAWQPADSDPHGYDTDKQIEARVDGDRFVWKVPKTAVFKRKAVGTPPVMQPASWSTGLVWWTPGVKPKKISFRIRKPSGAKAAYKLQLLGATGPSGALTLIDEWGLGAAGPGSVDKALAGSYDLLMLRVYRDTEAKDPAKFSCVVDDVRLSDLAATETYTAEQVFKDLFARMGAGTGGVAASTQNVMPLHLQEASLGSLADEVAALASWHWGIYANDEGGKRGEAAPWGTQEWTVAVPELPVQLVPQERFNVVSIDYKYAGGAVRTKRVRANPDPIPGWTNVYRIELDSPPSEDVATAFAQAVANYLADRRWSGQATITTVVGALGAVKSAMVVEPGDVLILQNNGGRRVRVQSVSHDPSGAFVTVTFASGHPLLDRILARRHRRLSIGWSGAKATLSGLGLERPAAPATTLVGFREVDLRGGRRRYDAVVDWSEVDTDVEGSAHAMRAYIVQARPVDAAGALIPEADGGGIRDMRVSHKDDDDGAGDPHIPTRIIVKNLEKPHKWRWQFRVRAVSVLGQKGAWTAWSTPVKPAAFGPPAATNLVVKKRRGKLEADWDANDPTETEADGQPILDRRIAFFKVTKYRNDVQVGKVVRTRSTSKTWSLPKPWNGTWKVKVVTVDHYGNEG